jgi:maltooligosyltrehalose trehalohydrolase
MAWTRAQKPTDGTTVSPLWRPSLGAWPTPQGWTFRVWAPDAREVSMIVDGGGAARRLAPAGDGTFTGRWADLRAGSTYSYVVDDRGRFPDPASRFQPHGVHGPSQLVDPSGFAWQDQQWTGPARGDLVIYELHVGTFTRTGTFHAAAAHLPALASLGITAIELMPLADFPGDRNWGYDGVALFAPARAYGTPHDLRLLVDAAHRLGLAVILDVVYNHFGPDGAYHAQFSADYYCDRTSPWGRAINLCGARHEMVRGFFIENALHWLHEYHIDGLRLDATHAYVDDPERPFVREFVSEIRERGPARRVVLTAEDDRNDAIFVTPEHRGGWGLDAIWADDFHHAMRRLLTGDHEGYFEDFRGTAAEAAEILEHGWLYRGQHSAFRAAPRGTPTDGLPLDRFVIGIQNHDQIGNRALGDRLHHRADLATYRAASALLLLAPETPLLFMGQEWAASSPFQYFTDHYGDLGEAVSRGRRAEFAAFSAFAGSGASNAVPDPQSLATFRRSQLDWDELGREPHRSTWRLYRDVLALRRSEKALGVEQEHVRAAPHGDDTVLLERSDRRGPRLLVVARLRGAGRVQVPRPVDSAETTGESWSVRLTTEDVPYAPDSARTDVRVESEAIAVDFRRPGAVVLVRTPHSPRPKRRSPRLSAVRRPTPRARSLG